MSESEQNTRESKRVCREEKPAPCEVCLSKCYTESHAVYLCVRCCMYYCNKHKCVHRHLIYAPNEKHTEIAFNETKEVRNRNFKLYLEELKADNLAFDERKISFSGLIDIRHAARLSKGRHAARLSKGRHAARLSKGTWTDQSFEGCKITGIVLLNDGRLALVDRNKNCIKFLNLESQKITSYIRIPFNPSYLSEYEIGKGVVTCPGSLIFIDLNTRTITRGIRVDGVCQCDGILRDRFIVSSTHKTCRTACIRIMNRDGKILELLHYTSTLLYPVEPYNLVVDKDRELFYIQEQGSVVCYNLTGTKLNMYTQMYLSQAMTIGPEGDVYVADAMSVHKLSPLLKESKIIIDKGDGRLNPFQPLAFCISRSQTLYACMTDKYPDCNYASLSLAGNYISYFREE